MSNQKVTIRIILLLCVVSFIISSMHSVAADVINVNQKSEEMTDEVDITTMIHQVIYLNNNQKDSLELSNITLGLSNGNQIPVYTYKKNFVTYYCF